MLEIKMLFGDWKEVTREQAESFYKAFCEKSIAIAWEDQAKYFNKHHIRGGHVMINGKVETTEEQKERVFQHYKSRITSGSDEVRFITIEYLCSYAKIDPYAMAASIVKDGITVLYNDSSISKKANEAKERKVKKLLI